jgi:putative endonuclease
MSKKIVGALGEKIAAQYLEKNGFTLQGRNIRALFGEIDIVAVKRGVVHIIEVKTVSREKKWWGSAYGIRPEDHVDIRKSARLERLGQWYMQYKGQGSTEWKISFVFVLLDTVQRVAHCTYVDHV